MRATLVTALSACAADRKRRGARRFLQGLSSDELQYIAEFLGASILESNERVERTRGQLADRIAEYGRSRRHGFAVDSDQDHKMILLLEYLCRCGVNRFSVSIGAGHA